MPAYLEARGSSSVTWGQSGNARLPTRLVFSWLFPESWSESQILFIFIPREEWDLSGAGAGAGTSCCVWMRSVPSREITNISCDHEATWAPLITVLCYCAHILKLSMTQLWKSCLSASHPLPPRMKNSELQGWACLMNVICFCWTKAKRFLRLLAWC